MPTVVTGNPTGVVAPAVQPGPDTAVVINEPIAGEGATAASVNQALTALANEQAWEKAPTAAAPTSPGALDAAYVQPVKAIHNARGQRRDFFDHRGFGNMARINRWQEDWSDVGFVAKTAAGLDQAWARRWLYSITVGAGSPTILTAVGLHPSGIGTPPYVGGSLILDTGNVTSSSYAVCLVEATPQSGLLVTADTDMAFQTEVVALDGETVFGLSPGVSAATNQFASTSPTAAGFMGGAGFSTIHFYSCLPGGSPVIFDTGVASGTRFRIDITDDDDEDDSNPRLIAYIDGAPVYNLGITFAPTNPSNRVPWQPFFRIANAGGNRYSRFGVTDFAGARWPGNIAY